LKTMPVTKPPPAISWRVTAACPAIIPVPQEAMVQHPPGSAPPSGACPMCRRRVPVPVRPPTGGTPPRRCPRAKHSTRRAEPPQAAGGGAREAAPAALAAVCRTARRFVSTLMSRCSPSCSWIRPTGGATSGRPMACYREGRRKHLSMRFDAWRTLTVGFQRDNGPRRKRFDNGHDRGDRFLGPSVRLHPQ
jgi:hypothetical protein